MDVSADFSVLYAPVGGYEATDFFSEQPPNDFQPLSPPTSISGVGKEAWLRTTLQPALMGAPADILEIPGQIFNYVDVWFRLPDGTISHDYAGVRYPYNERTVKNAGVAFRIPDTDGEPLQVLIRARNETSHSMNFAAWVWPEEQWATYVLTLRVWYGVFLGAILALCIYNLFLAVTLRDSSYLYYIGYVLCLTSCVFVLSGLAEEYLWPDGKPAPVVLALTGAGTFLGVGFVNQFLKVRLSSPVAYWTSTAVAAAAMIMGTTLIWQPKLPLVPAAYSASIVHILLMSAAIYFIAISLVSYFRGVTHARFLALSMLSLLASLVIYFAYTYGHLQYNLLIGHALEFGALTEGILLALALADRINLLTREKQQAERESLEYQRTFSRRLISAQEKERQSLAETMHDSIGHAMLVLKNNLQQGIAMTGADSEGRNSELISLLREQADYCGEIMHDVRRISHDLHPHILERLGLSAAVESTMSRALDPVGLQWSVEIDELCEELEPHVQSTIYRAIQECLNNILKYAHASEVRCELVCDDRWIKACIYDDGVGFDVKAAGKESLGLQEMYGRVQVVGGSMTIESAPGEGTTVAFRLPLAITNGQPGLVV